MLSKFVLAAFCLIFGAALALHVSKVIALVSTIPTATETHAPCGFHGQTCFKTDR